MISETLHAGSPDPSKCYATGKVDTAVVAVCVTLAKL